MARLLMNSAMIPNEGTFSYRNVDVATAAQWLKDGDATSYIGYQQTADHISAIGGVSVPLNRAKCAMGEGDVALIVKLAYRVQDPKSKGEPQPEDWEYGILRRIRAPVNERPYDPRPMSVYWKSS